MRSSPDRSYAIDGKNKILFYHKYVLNVLFKQSISELN